MKNILKIFRYPRVPNKVPRYPNFVSKGKKTFLLKNPINDNFSFYTFFIIGMWDFLYKAYRWSSRKNAII